MKRFIFVIALMFATMFGANAQTTVYFGNLDSKVSIGVGIAKEFNPNVTLSIMQIDKSKNFDEFSFKFVDSDGNPVSFTLNEDTIYHLDMDKSYSHQIDYTISRIEYNRMCQTLNNTSYTVYINNVEYTGAAFVGILRALEYEQTMISSGMGRTFQNITMWNFPNRNIEFMRMQNVNDNNKKNANRQPSFRFIRRPMNAMPQRPNAQNDSTRVRMTAPSFRQGNERPNGNFPRRTNIENDSIRMNRPMGNFPRRSN